MDKKKTSAQIVIEEGEPSNEEGSANL